MAWLTLAGAIPIIIHLLNRQRYRKIRWAAMEFLLQALKKTKRRLQMENLILLIIRVMIVVLLAFALARCYFQETPLAALGTTDTHAFIIIDNSYSMGYKIGKNSVFDTAKNIANGLVDKLKPSHKDKASLIALSSKPSIVVSEASANMELVKKSLANMELSHYATSCYETFLAIQDLVKRSNSSRKIIYLITDCQRSGWIVRDENRAKFTDILAELSGKAEVKIIDIGMKDAVNTNVNGIRSLNRIIRTQKTANFEVEVNNFSPSSLATLEVSFYVDDLKHNSASIPVGQYGLGVVSFPYEFAEPGSHQVKAILEADNLEQDNTRYLTVDVRESVRVLVVDGEPSADPYEDETMYLKYALQPSRIDVERFSIYAIDTVSDIVFEETDISKYDLVIMANLEYVSQDKLKKLEEFVRSGGGLLIFLGDKVDRIFYNQSLYRNGEGLLPGELIEILGDKEHQTYTRLEKADFNHEALSYFLPIKDYLTRVFIYEYYRMKVPEPSAEEKDKPENKDLPEMTTGQAGNKNIRVLARYNDTDENPAIAEKLFGKGKVIAVTTAADIEWNNLPATPGGVILYDQLAKFLSTPDVGFKNISVGEPLKLIIKPSEFSPTFSLIMPERGIKSLSPEPLPGEQGFALTCPENDTGRAGFYTLDKLDADEQSKLFTYFAVNLNPTEGDLKKISEEELKQLYPSFKFELFSQFNEQSAQSIAKPPASNIWKYLIWTVLVLLAMETVLAQRFGSAKK